MISLSQYRTAIGIFNFKKNRKFLKVKDSNIMMRGAKSKYNIKVALYMLIIYLAVFSSFNYEKCSSDNNNKITHILNGNRNGNNIKFFHWNKGSSLFQNKVDHLKILIDKYKPNILSISKANYNIESIWNTYGLEDYNIEFTDQKMNYKVSRQILLIDKRLMYERRYDLESKHDCMIWIQVKIKNRGVF